MYEKECPYCNLLEDPEQQIIFETQHVLIFKSLPNNKYWKEAVSSFRNGMQ